MIKDNIIKVRERVNRACSKVNRDPSSITIVAVTKGRSAQEIREAVEQGITDIGENRLQEAAAKYNELRAMSHEQLAIKWHMVGHLQTNKIKDAVKIFDLIQSVDSFRLASKINEEAAKINKIQDILLEIKTSPEATKFGFSPEEVLGIIKEISGFKSINIKGLMTIASLVDDPQKSRPYFRILRELKDTTYDLRPTTYDLSMGMTDDFEVAIEEGATIVRLGRAIFE